MSKNLEFILGWIKKFPFTFALIPISIYISVFKDSIEQEPLVDVLSSGDLFTILAGILIVVFGLEIFRAYREERKNKLKTPIKYHISRWQKGMKAANGAFFFAMDGFSIWVIFVTLAVIGFGIWNDGFEKASFFANFHAIAIVPFASFLVYYGEHLKENLVPA